MTTTQFLSPAVWMAVVCLASPGLLRAADPTVKELLTPPPHQPGPPPPPDSSTEGVLISCPKALIKAGFVRYDGKGIPRSMPSPVDITIVNGSGKSLSTTARVTGRDDDCATVKLERTEPTAEGLVMHLDVPGLDSSSIASQTWLTVEAKSGDKILAAKSIPIRTVVPFGYRLPDEGKPMYEGTAKPGFVNRACNHRTSPRCNVHAPEAMLISACLQEITMTALDQFGDVLDPMYAGTPIFASLGDPNMEHTNCYLQPNGTWVEPVGDILIVHEVKDLNKEEDRQTAAAWAAAETPPFLEKYGPRETLTLAYSLGGHGMGLCDRTITYIDSGDPQHPKIRVDLKDRPPLTAPPEKDPESVKQ